MFFQPPARGDENGLIDIVGYFPGFVEAEKNISFLK
jgi:hypothetical protein